MTKEEIKLFKELISEIKMLRETIDGKKNKRKPKTVKTSNFNGVCFDRRTGKYRAQIYADKQVHHLGYFELTEIGEIEAAKEYDRAIHKFKMPESKLNFKIQDIKLPKEVIVDPDKIQPGQTIQSIFG